MTDEPRTMTAVVITPCARPVGLFHVRTYTVIEYRGGFRQGSGFTRDRGFFTAHDLVRHLIATPDAIVHLDDGTRRREP